MLDLFETAVDIAKQKSKKNKRDAVDDLAGAVEMGVLTLVDDDGDELGQGINILLPRENTGDEPILVQVCIETSGELEIDVGMEQETAESILEDQILDAQARLEFCQEALEKLRSKQTTKKTLKYVSNCKCQ